jgi:hypothetical protein
MSSTGINKSKIMMMGFFIAVGFNAYKKNCSEIIFPSFTT